MSAPVLFPEGQGAMTLLQFTTAIGNAVRMTPALQGAWVVAELSDVRVSGGHCYMELVEKSVSGQTVAKLRATIWQSRFQYIRQKFFAATGREVMTGMKVMLYGAASHHTLYGLSFTVNDIDPSYTLGDMERLRREILMRLHNEGILGLNKTRCMPMAPQRIAVISAAGAAGFGDFMNQLAGNADGFVFYPHLFQAVMQGERTSLSVREALGRIQNTVGMWDCVAIIRGGGATTDLNGFDDYDLARAVAVFPLPVVVGIGHERDRTVLDEIAHTRMKTPTAVASFFIDTLRSSFDNVLGIVDRVAHYANDCLQGEHRRLVNCEAMLPALAETRLTAARALLDREMTRIPVLVQSRLNTARGRLDSILRLVGALSEANTSQASRSIDALKDRLAVSVDVALRREMIKLENLAGLVDVLSPSNTLRRGYSITRVEGKAVTDADGLKTGQTIETEFRHGRVSSIVR